MHFCSGANHFQLRYGNCLLQSFRAIRGFSCTQSCSLFASVLFLFTRGFFFFWGGGEIRIGEKIPFPAPVTHPSPAGTVSEGCPEQK